MVDLGQAAAWHRQIVALAEAADRAGVAPAQLPTLRARLYGQQSRFAEAVARGGAPLPALVPSPMDIAAAASAFGDLSPEAVDRSVQSAQATLDQVDAALMAALTAQPAPIHLTTSNAGTPPAPPPAVSPASGEGVVAEPPSAGNRTLRNGLIYGCFAMGVVAVQVVAFVLLDEEGSLLTAAPFCLLVLPAFAWLGGWLTIGAVTPSVSGMPTNRHPRLGAVICALPDLLLCAVLGALFALDLAQR